MQEPMGVPIVVLVLITLQSDGGPASTALGERTRRAPERPTGYELASGFDRAVVTRG